jgi:hypothetical protein
VIATAPGKEEAVVAKRDVLGGLAGAAGVAEEGVEFVEFLEPMFSWWRKWNYTKNKNVLLSVTGFSWQRV